MGPLPHIHFERLILEKMRDRGVLNEQEYPVWVTINAAPMPDRTKCILLGNEECVPGLVTAGEMLAKAGAHFLVAICNTAHAFRERASEQLSIPWVDMLRVVAFQLKVSPTPVEAMGLLATDGTLRTELYPRALQSLGLHSLTTLYPSPSRQKGVMDAIYDKTFGIKSAAQLSVKEEAIARFEDAARELMASGASVIISGCTEISLCSSELQKRGIPILDPLTALAETVIDLSYGEANISAYV
jgi:aspartate racemase